jgi:hypothetical protein
MADELHTSSGTRKRSASLHAWRVDRLRAAGFAPDLAEDLVARGRFDLHELIDLAERGCPPELAARILAPLDREAPDAPRADPSERPC